MKKTVSIILIVIALVIGVIAGALLFREKTNLGSVTQGNEYYATSTPWDTSYTSGKIKSGYGSLNSVIITSAGDVSFRLLDATTTDGSNRPIARSSTSSAELVRFPANTVVGTYTFDITFIDGLYLEVISGTTGTSTITYR